MNKKSFTLIELLVATIIIGILAAVILPVIGKTRELSRRVQCINNLRQISIAFYLYLEEHGEIFPEGGGSPGSGQARRTWEGFLYPSYIDDPNVFICRSVEKVMDYRGGDGKELIYKENFYGYNGFLTGKKISEVIKSSNTILCADAKRADLGMSSSGEDYFDFSISSRHSQGADILFVGGNVNWFSIDTINENTSGGEGGWWGWTIE